MDKKTATVLVVSNHNKETISFNIPYKHIKNIKLYSGIICSLIFAMIATIFAFFININTLSNTNNELNLQLSDIKKQNELLDSMKVRNKINIIEERLNNIDKYLNERGVKEDLSYMGGEYKESGHNIFEIFDLFDEHSQYVYENINKIPAGYPYIGEIKSEYGYRKNPFGGSGIEFHSGIDLKGSVGAPVLATADGTVKTAEWQGGFGKCVTLLHKFGYETIYGHLSEFNVTSGENVKTGDTIGYIGSTGRSSGPHLHYEIKHNGVDINPNIFLNLKREK